MKPQAPALPVALDVPPPVLRVLEVLWRDGFVRVPKVLSTAEVGALRDECARLMREQPRRPWSARADFGTAYELPVFVDKDWSVLSNIAGLSGSLDLLLERLFTHEEIVPLLRGVLGTGYKTWQIGIRRSEGTDGGLRMHQDARGEFGFSVLLADVGDRGGATAFLPGTHRFPLRSREAGMDYLDPKYLRRWATSVHGEAGDIVLFFNQTWHGRLPTRHPQPHDAIILSFFGAGYAYTPFDVPAPVLARLPPELRRLLDPREGLARLPDGRAEVLGRQSQPPRLIDAVANAPATVLHAAQLLRLLPPVFAAAHPVRRWLKKVRPAAGRGS